MTLREESGTGPPADGASVADPQEPADSPQEPADSPQEPADSPQEPATPAVTEEHGSPPEPGTGTGPTSPDGPARPAGAGALASPAGPAGAGAPASPGIPAGPDTPPAPDTPAGPDTPTGPDRPAGPAHPGGPAGRRRSSAALLAGILVATCLIGLGGFAAVLLLHGRTPATRVALPPVFRLRAGECVNFAPAGVSSPTVVPCSQPHDAEIYARFGLAGHRWPGTTAVGAQARQGCTVRLSGYLNPQLATSVLAESYVFPDQGAWNAGERTVICEIRGTAGKLTGSVRGLG